MKFLLKNNNVGETIDEIVVDLKERSSYLYALPSSALIDFFDVLMRTWEDEKTLRELGLSRNLIDFFKRDNLINTLNIELRGNIGVLDDFQDLGHPTMVYRAQPRGLVVQWLAGNVPILGIFSIFCAILTKNATLVKASSSGYESLLRALNTLKNVKTDKVDGEKILENIAVVLVDNADQEEHRQLSLSADVRIAWGGREAIEAIESLDKKLFCEDIIFGPKYSYALIDQESLIKNAKELAQRLALDIATFDQNACSSPHTVFIEKGSYSGIDFAQELANQMEIVQRTLMPKAPVAPEIATQIIAKRNEHLIAGDKVWKSDGTEWTVIYSETDGLVEGCPSRFIVIKPINNLMDLGSLNDRQKQTLGLGMSVENKHKYMGSITRWGIDRCPNLGRATFYESPWDGLFIFDRLVRWVSMYK